MGGWKNWERVADPLGDTGVYLDTSFSLGKIRPLSPGHYSEEMLQMLTPGEFCALVRAFGAERILFGTDSPWTSQTDSLEALRSLPLTSRELACIEYQNAKKLLALDAQR